jgi:iron complex outermembrane receptor protein
MRQPGRSSRTRREALRTAWLCIGPAAWMAAAVAQPADDRSLGDLSLEQLGEIRVISVTGRPVAVQETAASIFVITGEDIRRSAATSLPEALRLAPNLQVARLNSSQYAISARGFNNAVGNKLLVLIDGRTVYSPLFSGVFWDAQDVPLQEIERIEVISGPGGTLWGANAVNGVINVITRAAGSSGTLVAANAGRLSSQALARTELQAGGARVRAYAMRLNRDNTFRQSGEMRPDATDKDQAGFRADWLDASREITLQGDAYEGGRDASSNLSPRISGANLLARYKHTAADGSNWQLQAYLDRAQREDDVLFRDRTETADIEFNHVPATGSTHRVIWGAGYRHARSQADRTAAVLFQPALRQMSWANVFAQDEWRLSERVRLTAGLKLEHNAFTGLEALPTLRASWSPGAAHAVWASLSRAVRAPSRIDRDFFFPSSPPFFIKGNPDFDSEIVNVAELGYRGQPNASLNYSLTAFHHDARGLRGGTPGPSLIQNRVAGVVEGVEAWGTWTVNPAWRLSGGLVSLRKSLAGSPGTSATSVPDLGNDPREQWQLRSSFDLPRQMELDVWVRHVGSLPSPQVPAYTATSLRLGWRPVPQWTVSLQVQNLFDPNHAEFNAVSAASQIPRSAFLSLEWRPR